MSRRRGIEALQNLAIALLAASALLLVLLVVSYESGRDGRLPSWQELDRKSTRLNSSHP